MKRKSFQRPGERPRGWQETLALLIAATLIVIGFWGAATAATCTGSSFNGSGFTLSDTTGVGQGTISVSGRDGDITSVSVTITFSALPRPDDYEIDHLGFNLYREQGGQRTRINPHIIAGPALLVGGGTTLRAGHSYTWWDTSAAAIADVRYWLEDIDHSGKSTWHRPVTVVPSSVSSQTS